MGSVLQDIRYGFRVFVKSPFFTVVAVLTLALGIGANTMIFSLVYALLLKPLPGVEAPDRLISVYTSDFSSTRYGSSSYPDYLDYRDRNEVFDGLIAYKDSIAMSLNADDQAERIIGAVVTGNYFSVLGSKAAMGRTLLPEDDAPSGASQVAVVSYQTWKRRFGSDPDLVGKTLRLNTLPFTVVGIAAGDFRGTSISSPVEIWIPMGLAGQVGYSDMLDRRGARWLRIMGRLNAGITQQQAQANVDVIAAQLAEAHPQTNRGTLQEPDKPRPVSLVAANDVAAFTPASRSATKQIAYLLMGAVGFVLLIACANVANLLLARAGARRKEIAIRLALGASRSRLIRQLLIESALFALVGGAVGLLLSVWMNELVLLFDLPAALDMSLDRWVLGFTLLVSMLTGILFGLAPALGASKPDLVPTLKDANASGIRSAGRFGLRNILVASQVAISLLLLIGAGLFLKSLQTAYNSDPGFETRNALLATVDLGLQKYSESQGKAFYKQLEERVASLPGVQSASLAAFVPVSTYSMSMGISVEGYQPQPGEVMEPDVNIVGTNYFQTIGIRLLRGRGFTEQDEETAASVVIINETMARRFWPDSDALGKRISFEGSEGPFTEIIGVVKTGKYRSFREEPMPSIYVPLAQMHMPRVSIIARTEGDPIALAAALRNETGMLDKNMPVFDIKTLTEHMGKTLYQERMIATLLAIFGLLALALAGVGIYGVMSYSVTQRTREIGIRMALGANPLDVVKIVLRQGLALTLIGVITGLGAAFALTRLMESLLFEVSATDTMTFSLVAMLLTGVALVACYIPARRAAKVDPMVALRYE